MASLTNTAILTRKIIRYSVYAVIIIIIARYAFKGVASFYKNLFPPKQPKPTVSFGKLPALPFPERNTDIKLDYVLETPDGNLPVFPDQEKVYYMPPLLATLHSLENARAKAASLKFEPPGRQVVESVPNVYLFKSKDKPSTLTMNIITGIFSILYDVNSNPSVLDNLPLQPASAIGHVRSYLQGAGVLANDIKESPANANLLRVEGGKYVPAISLSEANLSKVNIFRKLLGKNNNLQSVTPEMPEANIWFLLSGTGGREIISAEYNYYPIDENTWATYPLKTSGKAWEELKNGRAYIANISENKDGKITIRNVYLAYYDPGLYYQFYQPVAVFQGDNNFYAFVPAVTDEYYTAK